MAKYLILKAPPVGLGSLMVTTLCGKIYAQLTGRIPIVLWRQRCLYYESTSKETLENTFETYFEPLSDATIADVIGKQYTYYPACWNDQNILDDTLLQHNRAAHLSLPVEPEFSGSEADVLVISEYPGITSYLPALLNTYDRFRGLSELEVLSQHFQGQLELKPYLKQRVKDFQDTHFNDHISIGLRIRKTDFAALRAVPSDSMYINAVKSRMADLKQPAKLFLATDCAKTAVKFKRIYGDQICYTDCIRSETSTATHLCGGAKRTKGEQMLLDLYVLAGCDYFIGSDSNWIWLVTRILNDPLVNPDRNTYLSPTIGQKVWKRVELSSTALLKSVVHRSKTVTRSLLRSA
ncbi:unknown protein [Leptolyngbya sp. NIES-3755]|nr:unknown protein [Leptolyngbya sp. NIES-3755]